jgi:CRISPR-associated endonuclease/helicase Cas3
VPRFVLERFGQQLSAGVEVEREAFNKAVYEVFPTEAEFKRYTQRWGVVQAALVVAELKKLKDENTAFVDALMQRYEQFYGAGDAALPVMNKALKKYWRIEKRCPEILTELVSFRGQSPLSCGVWDSDGHVQSYDLFFLLTNTEFEAIDKQEFMQQVKAKQADEREFEHQLLYIRVSKYIEERQSLILRVNLDLVQQGNYIHNIMVMEDITVLAPRATWLNEVNRALKRKKLVCIISRMKPAELKAGLHLGMLFQVVRMEDQVGSQYSIAFGQEALLLETELFFREDKGGGAMML